MPNTLEDIQNHIDALNEFGFSFTEGSSIANNIRLAKKLLWDNGTLNGDGLKQKLNISKNVQSISASVAIRYFRNDSRLINGENLMRSGTFESVVQYLNGHIQNLKSFIEMNPKLEASIISKLNFLSTSPSITKKESNAGADIIGTLNMLSKTASESAKGVIIKKDTQSFLNTNYVKKQNSEQTIPNTLETIQNHIDALNEFGFNFEEGSSVANNIRLAKKLLWDNGTLNGDGLKQKLNIFKKVESISWGANIRYFRNDSQQIDGESSMRCASFGVVAEYLNGHIQNIKTFIEKNPKLEASIISKLNFLSTSNSAGHSFFNGITTPPKQEDSLATLSQAHHPR